MEERREALDLSSLEERIKQDMITKAAYKFLREHDDVYIDQFSEVRRDLMTGVDNRKLGCKEEL